MLFSDDHTEILKQLHHLIEKRKEDIGNFKVSFSFLSNKFHSLHCLFHVLVQAFFVSLFHKFSVQLFLFKNEMAEKQMICQKEIDNISVIWAQVIAKIELRNKDCKRLDDEIGIVKCNLMEAANSSSK